MKKEYDELLEAGNKAQYEQIEKTGLNKVGLFLASDKIIDYGYDIRNKLKSSKNQNNKLEIIRKYSANIANLAHIIISKCDKELNNES